MPEVLRRHFLRESDAKQVLNDFCRVINANPEQFFGSKPRVELIETKQARIFLFNRTPFSVEVQDTMFPTLFFKEVLSFLPQVVVDMGAIPYICSGADIMAPGIVAVIGDFGEGDFLTVVDQLHRKPLAIGQALSDSETLRAMKRGKVADNIHYVGDKIWNLLKTII